MCPPFPSPSPSTVSLSGVVMTAKCLRQIRKEEEEEEDRGGGGGGKGGGGGGGGGGRGGFRVGVIGQVYSIDEYTEYWLAQHIDQQFTFME